MFWMEQEECSIPLEVISMRGWRAEVDSLLSKTIYYKSCHFLPFFFTKLASAMAVLDQSHSTWRVLSRSFVSMHAYFNSAIRMMSFLVLGGTVPRELKLPLRKASIFWMSAIEIVHLCFCFKYPIARQG
jgi:hypothetical protein